PHRDRDRGLEKMRHREKVSNQGKGWLMNPLKPGLIASEIEWSHPLKQCLSLRSLESLRLLPQARGLIPSIVVRVMLEEVDWRRRPWLFAKWLIVCPCFE